MKRIVRFLARLYPKLWRARYGNEFDALLDDAKPTPRDAADIFRGALKMQMTTWTFGGITLACATAGVLLAGSISFVLPAHYVSKAVITASPADEFTLHWVGDLAGRVLSPEYLASLIQQDNLYPRDRARKPIADVVENMRKNIQVNLVVLNRQAANDRAAFVIRFDYPDGRVAQQVAGEIVSRFIEGNLTHGIEVVGTAGLLVSHPSILTVLDPPSLPLKPVASYRIVIVLTGLLAGVTVSLLNRFRQAARPVAR